jgi:hypothetical protein
MPACLAGHDYATRLSVLQTPLYVRALLGNAWILPLSHYSQILLYSSPSGSRRTRGGTGALPSGEARSGAMGCMVAREPSRARRRDPEPWDVWRYQSPFERGGGVWKHGTRGSTGALPKGRPRLVSWDMRQCVDTHPASCLSSELVHGGTRSVGYQEWPPGLTRERCQTCRWGHHLP